ncbi:serine carboxypeptidase [Teratosphaeria nubilosa]|uniref:Serine carboxypeptidase n=1 Tax=Teratosphaeria nubilosa TaxID=161662 RepID=A0A6G1KX04_9PEZI|nr:serine carboxypeptidase [Teratosphaeria nubilosa]
MPGRDWQNVPTSGNSTFKQLIDHNNPDLGTFDQFYYYDSSNWAGPGSPVIMFTPGEVAASGYQSYLTSSRTTGVLAEKIGAAAIVLEHRYWGTSSPYDDLTTENMKYLTLDQAIHDLTYFANNAKLPWATHASANAKDVPWVLMGGSYSGALSAWTESVAPGTYWAYHASSAPVEAISDYWGYFLPVQEGMPKNCSKDVSLVIDYMDAILMNGAEEQIYGLKAKFGMENVTHNDDFMAALENGPWLWQSNQFYTGYSSFFQWCDYIEGMQNATNSTIRPSADGVGLTKALDGYATWWKDLYLPGYCASYGYDVFNGTYNTYCFDTYDPTSPIFTDISLTNEVDRQWEWMLCNEPFGYWQDGAPSNRPTIVSRLVDANYWIRQCALYFPPGPDGETYGIAKGKTEADVNAHTSGWFIDNSTRLIYANGGYDPWREASTSSELRPGGPLQSTAAVPVNVVPGGFHTSDLVTENGEVNEGCQVVIDKTLAQLESWVNEWPGFRNGTWWRA